MIQRDELGFILQHIPDFENQTWKFDANSPGDTISRTAINAIGGVKQDQDLLAKFEISPGRFARHPYTKPWNSYADRKYGASRDQRTCYMAALKIFGKKEVAERIRKKTWFFVVNDLLLPDLKFLDALAADHWSKYLWSIVGIPNVIGSILWSCYVTPKKEINQMACEALAVGRWAIMLLVLCHPDWKANIEDYFGVCNERNNFNPHGKWRDQPEIAKAFIHTISKVVLKQQRKTL